MDETKTTTLKRDATGRISYDPEQRAAVLDEFERSGRTDARASPCGTLPSVKGIAKAAQGSGIK
jgi:hypothetical protein